MGKKGSGDVLASGRADKASYQMPSISEEKWAAMWEEEKPKPRKRKSKASGIRKRNVRQSSRNDAP